jgi:hypothetical protein
VAATVGAASVGAGAGSAVVGTGDVQRFDSGGGCWGGGQGGTARGRGRGLLTATGRATRRLRERPALRR